MNNPYHAPAADLSAPLPQDEGYAPAFMSLGGRIGRLRYLAYTLVPSFALLFVCGIVLAVVMPALGRRNAGWALLCYLPVFVLLFVMGVRRLHDLNWPGWISLLSLIPVVNLLFGLLLLCLPGSPGPNRYGSHPRKNTGGVVALACVAPVVMVFFVGVMAAVAIPAYQSYVKRAKQMQQKSAPAPQQDAVRSE